MFSPILATRATRVFFELEQLSSSAVALDAARASSATSSSECSEVSIFGNEVGFAVELQRRNLNRPQR